MKRLERLFISLGLCLWIMTGCQKDAPEILVLSEADIELQPDEENHLIQRIELTADVHSIQTEFFLKYKTLEYIDVAEDNLYYTSVDGVLYTKDVSAVVAYPIGRTETNYTIPTSCVAIYSYAFAESKLENITLSESMYEIGADAFGSELQKIHIPKNVYYIAPRAFVNCASLTEITVDKDNLYHSDIDGVLFNSTQDALSAYPQGRTEKTYTVPASCKIFAEYSFANVRFLEEIYVPAKLEWIREHAFEGTSVAVWIGGESSADSDIDGK